MSIEIQRAPDISQIGLNRSGHDLFHLDESGLITTETIRSKTQVVAKSKEEIFNDESGVMASRYPDDYDSYEDDFEDGSPERNRSTRRPTFDRETTYSDITRHSPTPPRRAKNKTTRRKDSFTSYRSAYGTSRATKPVKKVKKSQSASSRPHKMEENSVMVQRILSANRNKISKLYNVVEDLQHEVDHLRQENKTLKRIHVKQEREIQKIEKEEASLPKLLHRHSAELRTYRERLKKNKQEISKKEKESHTNDTEIFKLREKLQYYKTLDNDKKLEERATLAKRLEKVEHVSSEKDMRILELQKTIKLTEKARQREIKEQQERYKKSKDELRLVQEDVISLREKLKGREKQLEVTNIYHQQIQKRMRKAYPLALPPVPAQDLPAIAEDKSLAQHPVSQKKKSNIFLTNAHSDTSSNATADADLTENQMNELRNSLEKSKDYEKINSEAGKRLELEKLEALRRKDEFERQARKQREEEERRRQEEDMKREQERQEQIQKLQEERKREEQRELEEMVRKRAEEERIRKEREEQKRLKFNEDKEVRSKKDMLLARMKAIDGQSNTKPNGIIDVEFGSKSQNEKPKKLPIFLQSSQKPKEPTEKSSHEPEKLKSGSTSSVQSKHSQSSSYDFKETTQNLHHGLPAHPSDQHLRSQGAKARRDSLDGELAFGSYKPSVAKKEVAPKKTENFGSYNPSFSEAKKDTGHKNSELDFSKKKHEQTISPPSKDKNEPLFSSYQPTFGGGSNPARKPEKDTDTLDFSSRKERRRNPGNPAQNSLFGDDIFNNNEIKQSKGTSLFNYDDVFGPSSKPKDGSYPWEKKVSVTDGKSDNSLLPRRPKVHQSLNQGHEKNTPAVGNVLNDTLEDDIEEVTL